MNSRSAPPPPRAEDIGHQPSSDTWDWGLGNNPLRKPHAWRAFWQGGACLNPDQHPPSPINQLVLRTSGQWSGSEYVSRPHKGLKVRIRVKGLPGLTGTNVQVNRPRISQKNSCRSKKRRKKLTPSWELVFGHLGLSWESVF